MIEFEINKDNVYAIPSNVTHLRFNKYFNLKLEPGKFTIPNSVIDLSFENVLFDFTISGVIPEGVTHLHLGRYNKLLELGDIPPNVTHLTFGDSFNQIIPVGTIPISVTHLKFGYHFNQTLLVGSIPKNVTHLEFGEKFNQPVEASMIPNIVTHLTFGTYFNQILHKGIIPESVQFLNLGPGFHSYDYIEGIPKNTYLTCTIYEEHQDLNDDRYLNKEMILKRVNHLIIYGIDSYYSFDINHVIPNELLKRIYDNLTISVLVDFNHELLQNISQNKVDEDTYLGDSPHYENYKKQIWGPYQDFFHIQSPHGIFPQNYDKIMKKRKQINLLKIVHQELIEKIFDPIRIQKICEKNGIELFDWIQLSWKVL